MHPKLQDTIDPVQTALAILNRRKKRALLHESVLQEQARACHAEAMDLEALEHDLRESKDAETAKQIIKATDIP